MDSTALEKFTNVREMLAFLFALGDKPVKFWVTVQASQIGIPGYPIPLRQASCTSPLEQC
jgi:hypothetical protein